jgi:hypothetical protein
MGSGGDSESAPSKFTTGNSWCGAPRRPSIGELPSRLWVCTTCLCRCSISTDGRPGLAKKASSASSNGSCSGPWTATCHAELPAPTASLQYLCLLLLSRVTWLPLVVIGCRKHGFARPGSPSSFQLFSRCHAAVTTRTDGKSSTQRSCCSGKIICLGETLQMPLGRPNLNFNPRTRGLCEREERERESRERERGKRTSWIRQSSQKVLCSCIRGRCLASVFGAR